MLCRSSVGAVAAPALVLLMCCGGAGALEPGDEAPALQVARWIKGAPVRLAEGKGRIVYVVQFWATDSPQCVGVNSMYTALQKQFEDRGVVCIAVTSEPAETVEEFVAKQGRQIGFGVAVDDRERTRRAYLEAAGVRGLPHAFIVDRTGRIAWHGHPLDDLEAVLEGVVAEDYRPGALPRRGGKRRGTGPEATATELLERFGRAYDAENWEQALGYLDRLIELNPDERRYLMLKLHLLLARLGDVGRANEWGLTLVETHREEAGFLNELSWRLLTTAEYGSRCMELAYKAALAAQEASGGTRYDITDTLARALYQIGRLDQAIRLQERAVRLAEERDTNEVPLQEMRQTLRYYRDCAAVRDQADPLGDY